MKLKENKKVVYDDFLHTYQCGGKTLIGVTSLIDKFGLGESFADVDPEVLNNAAARGSAVHKAIEDYNNGKQVVIYDVKRNGKIVHPADRFKADFDAYVALGLKAVASEYLISDNKTVASKIDIVEDCGEEDMVDLCDVKTKYRPHIGSLENQLGLYKLLFELQNPKIKVRKCWCLHLRDGKCKRIEVKPISQDKAKAIIKAEAEGRIYSEPKTNALSIISPEVLSRIVKTDIAITEVKAKLKELEDSTAIAKESLYQYMLEHDLKELECEGGRIVLKAPTQRQGVDSKKLQSEYPEVYNACVKVSEVKGNITFKSK